MPHKQRLNKFLGIILLMTILAIETSCDETLAAVMDGSHARKRRLQKN
jgi:hypothetical protein